MKRYLITGASRGIGRAIAQKLAGAEHTLLLHGRDSEALAKTCSLVEAKSGKVIPLCYDLRYTGEIEKMIDEIGSPPLDALINNAGIAVIKPLGEITLEEWETIFAVNVTAPFLLTQRLVPKMVTGSSIVNILSVAAKTGFPDWSSYCMSKFALEDFLGPCAKRSDRAGSAFLTSIPRRLTRKSGTWSRENGREKRCCCRKRSVTPSPMRALGLPKSQWRILTC
jgi:NAD(P)-dependent dehydrogenase (short-subunit alcohol dehydrogenase family)